MEDGVGCIVLHLDRPGRTGYAAPRLFSDLAHKIARDDGAETDAVQQARAAVTQARGT